VDDPRRLLLIGIGAGEPQLLTQQAVAAIGEVDAFLVVDKGETTGDLARLRADLVARHGRPDARTVVVPEPPRDRTAEAYEQAVQDWLDLRCARFEEALLEAVPPGGTAALLVWGDPTLYDGTLRIVDAMHARGRVAFRHEVVPGISAVQLLVARHGVPLNRIGEAVHVTTGRRLAAGLPDGVDNVVVMLDAGFAAASLPEPEQWQLWWGAYLGTPDESLAAGRLDEVGEQVAARKAALRAEKGWIMDTYLLRRTRP
jgi:precorrin-6A synthase